MTLEQWSKKNNIPIVKKENEVVFVKATTNENYNSLFELSDMEIVAITHGTVFLATRATVLRNK